MIQNNRILIVDDQEDLREQLGKLLIGYGQPNKTSSLVQSMRARLMGIDHELHNPVPKIAPRYDIDTAGQGQDAFEMVQAAIENNAPYAVMFTDMRMPPGWDGLETAKKVREIDKNIEIVIMTAYADHDQNTIAQEVGMPEKLLYIKKPFQAEEIFQLAMSLTAKWSAEYLERIRRGWLEKMLVCMRTARHYEDELINAPYLATLNSFQSFLGSTKGIIAKWDVDQKKWLLKGSKNIEEVFARNFLDKNAEHLQGCTAIQGNIDEAYVIPLKNNDFSAVIAIFDVQTQSDPEWYKLLNLLVITSLEGLENASIKAADYCESKNCKLIAAAKEIKADLEKVRKKYDSDADIKSLHQKMEKLIESASAKRA